jgi:hypothetical protein
MSVNGPRSLADLLQSGDVAKLKAAAAERRVLTDKVRAALPTEQADHLVSASIDENGMLVLALDSPVWAAKVHYELQALDGRAVRVKVVPRDGAGEPRS